MIWYLHIYLYEYKRISISISISMSLYIYIYIFYIYIFLPSQNINIYKYINAWSDRSAPSSQWCRHQKSFQFPIGIARGKASLEWEAYVWELSAVPNHQSSCPQPHIRGGTEEPIIILRLVQRRPSVAHLYQPAQIHRWQNIFYRRLVEVWLGKIMPMAVSPKSKNSYLTRLFDHQRISLSINHVGSIQGSTNPEVHHTWLTNACVGRKKIDWGIISCWYSESCSCYCAGLMWVKLIHPSFEHPIH